MLVAFVGSLSTNKNTKDTIKGDHFETYAKRNNVALIFLALFISWNQLMEKFHLLGALLNTYLDYCWEVWEKSVENLEKYTLYAAKNILHQEKVSKI